MRDYIIKRLLLIPFSLLGLTFFVFCLTRLVPGGPIEQMLQEQAIGALSGDSGSGSPARATELDEASLEQLEALFNLDEPLWKSYLQWLGIMPRKQDIAKSEFGQNGSAYITLARPNAPQAHVLELRRSGSLPEYLPEPWMQGSGWIIELESPTERLQRAKDRDGKHLVENKSYPWRAIAYHLEYEGLLQGSMGRSYKYNEPVMSMMLERLPVSIYFGLLAAIISYAVSIPLGVMKAIWHRSFFDYASSLLIFIGYAVPGFALGALLLVYLGARLEWFPLYGLVSSNFNSMSWQEQLADVAMHTVLPLCCYVVSTFAVTTMMMKNNLMEQLSSDYLRTAVAKGLPFHRAVWRHALRNAIIPIAANLGSIICIIVGGSLLIERVFDIQGFGMLSFQALLDKDYSLIMGTLLFSAVIIMIGNIIADIVVACIDCRIRFD